MNHWAAAGQAEQRHKCGKSGGQLGVSGGTRAGPDARGLPCCSPPDGHSGEGRFPCACCSTARWLCCSESVIARQEGGDGKRGGRGAEQEDGCKKEKKNPPKYHLPARLDKWGNGQPVAVCTAVNAFSS